jgi:hypothetical protein
MYPDHLPLSVSLREAHGSALNAIARPGSSWTGTERLDMVATSRAAAACSLCSERKSALTPAAVSGIHDGPDSLPPLLIDAIHRTRTDPGRLTRSWFDSVVEVTGLAAYVEMVSVVNSAVIIDTLHLSLGLSLAELPQPVAGAPTDEPTGEVVDDGAWVPISKAPRDMADTGMPVVPNIVRAMGLVPQAVSLFFNTFRPHYALKDIQLSISQAQAEFVASRVSAMNECFY